MHERSLIEALLEQVVGLVRAEGASRVLEVRVRLGPLTGVEPLCLSSAYDDLATGALFDGSRLVVSEVPLQAQCQECDTRFVVEDFHFRCAACGSSKLDTMDGDSVVLESVELAFSAPEESVHGNGL